jgi:homospermidine synthase
MHCGNLHSTLGKTARPVGADGRFWTHGANPGLVSQFVKQALLDIARDTGVKLRTVPKSRDEWGRLAQRLSVKVIHISERDTQVANQPKQVGEFVNTWSIEGFVSEGSQPSRAWLGHA